MIRICIFLLTTCLSTTAWSAITLRIENITITEGTASAQLIVLLNSDVGDAPLALTADIGDNG